jgi:ABC-type transport system involved in multi-copper enzyme maturation permease subunit
MMSSIAVVDNRRLINAEWIKLRSLRSTRWTLAAMVIASIGLGALICGETAAHWSHLSTADKATWDPTNNSLVGTVFGQLAIAVFGVLAIAGEYSSGTIRSSVAAAPRRTPLLAAKVVTYGGVALALGELVSFTSYFLGQALYGGQVPRSSIGDPGVARAVAMTGGYLALVCLIAIGIAIMLRHTAGAITSIVAILLVVPAIMAALPSSLQNSIGRFLPEQIASSSTGAVLPEPHNFSPWVGFGLMVLYAAIALGAGTWTFLHRDV